MTLRNRVRPDGALVAHPARGLLMGNRAAGQLHDPATRRLRSEGRRAGFWIACSLAVRPGRRARAVWGPAGRYTELFFCDEATALAAGHRPCFECRRADARAYAAAVALAEDLARPPSAPELDAWLHAERLRKTDHGRARGASVPRRAGGGEPPEGRNATHSCPWHDLPDGAMAWADGEIVAVRGDAVRPWSFDGYGAPRRRPRDGEAEVLTPPTSLAALRGGYRPLWHPSAGA